MTTRRHFLVLSTALVAPSLMAVTCTTNGPVTALTINVAEVNAFAQAAANGAAMVEGDPLILAAITAAAPGIPQLILLAVNGLAAATAAWNVATSGSATVTYDGTTITSAFQTVSADVQQVATQLGAAAAAVPSVGNKVLAGTTATIVDVSNAVKTAVSFLQAMVASVGAPLGAAAPMARVQMFATLRVTDPMAK
jgi:hypothetical protein